MCNIPQGTPAVAGSSAVAWPTRVVAVEASALGREIYSVGVETIDVFP